MCDAYVYVISVHIVYPKKKKVYVHIMKEMMCVHERKNKFSF